MKRAETVREESEISEHYVLTTSRSASSKPSSGSVAIAIYPLIAFSPANPPYHSALSLTSSEVYPPTYPVTRAEYLEHGSSICRRRFGGPAYNINPPGFADGAGAADLDDDERERRYAMGLESKKWKGKRKVEDEEEVTSGNWGGRRRRAMG